MKLFGVAGISISHHHHHSAWQKTELHRVYRDRRMTMMDWVMGADRDTRPLGMDVVTGSIYIWETSG